MNENNEEQNNGNFDDCTKDILRDLLEGSNSDEDEQLDFLLDIFMWNLCKLKFIDHTWQDAKWGLPVNNLLFMSIHKLYMSLLIMFIKFFVIQISYHGI